MKLVLFFIVCSSFVFCQNLGGSFIEMAKRDITYGYWIDKESGNYYVAEGDSGLRVYQHSGGMGGSINHLGTFSGGGSVYSVDVTGNKAYLASRSGGLQIVDVTNPAAMTLLGSRTDADLRVLAHAGDYVYAGSINTLYIYNISNPSSIQLVSSLVLPGDPKRFMVTGGRLFAALGEFTGGLQVVDISNPAAPALGTLFTYPGFVYDCVFDNMADPYLLFVAEGVRYHLYDISNSGIPPVYVRTDSVGGKVSRISHPGFVVAKDGSYIRLYERARIVTSIYAPGASEFVLGTGLEQVVVCGDSLYIYNLLISGADDPVLPDQYILHDNYPNPFNPSTTISFHLAEAGEVELRVYDMNGTEVLPALQQYHAAGSGSMVLEASRLASGVYFCQMRVNNFRAVKKLVLLR